MLSIELFIQVMKTLIKSYSNFNLDREQLEIWYTHFKNCSEKEFKEMIQVFITSSIYPPLGANHIKQVYNDEMKKQIQSNEVNSDRGWEIVIEAIRLHGLSYEWNVKKALDYIKEKGNDELVEVTQQYFRELENLQSNDTFLMNNFKKSYEVMIKRKVDDKHLELTNQTIKNLIGSGK